MHEEPCNVDVANKPLLLLLLLLLLFIIIIMVSKGLSSPPMKCQVPPYKVPPHISPPFPEILSIPPLKFKRLLFKVVVFPKLIW